MKPFEYYLSNSIIDTLNLLSQFKGESTLLAGGTDVIVKAKKGLINPKIIIDISKIKEMNYIEMNKKNIHIGAGTKLFQIANSDIINKNIKILANAAKKIGSIQIRNMATVGGNICNAAPSGDTLAPLMVLHAKVLIYSKNQERLILVKDLFKAPGVTVLNPYEIVKEIVIPREHIDTSMNYYKYTRRKGVDLAVVGCAIRLKVDPIIKTISEVDIALSSVAPTPIFIKGIKSMLSGKKLEDRLCKEVANVILDQISPIDDIRASKKYRKHIVNILIQKGLMEVYHNLLNNKN